MDANGRLHMPGFVGQTFAETGVKEEVEALQQQRSGPTRNPGYNATPAPETNPNSRAARRRLAKLERRY